MPSPARAASATGIAGGVRGRWPASGGAGAGRCQGLSRVRHAPAGQSAGRVGSEAGRARLPGTWVAAVAAAAGRGRGHPAAAAGAAAAEERPAEVSGRPPGGVRGGARRVRARRGAGGVGTSVSASVGRWSNLGATGAWVSGSVGG